MKDCCLSTNSNKECIRKKDKKTFKLPRKFSKVKCLTRKGIKGFTMRSSCAPYKGCKKDKSKKGGGNKYIKKTVIKMPKKQFLYNPNNPKKSFDVYIDKDPTDTISIKYTTIKDVKKTIKKLEKLYKSNKHSHKRIWQVGMIMYVRLKVLKKKKPKEFKLSEKYFKFLGKRTKIKDERSRKKFKFKY
jgi:hypothetical protein